MINIKFGVRKPNFKKSLKAKTTGRAKRALKSSVNPLYGKKGMGLVNNPKKAVYNKVYNKTTVSVIPKNSSKTKALSKSSHNNSSNSNPKYTVDNLNNVSEGIKKPPFPYGKIFIFTAIIWICDKFFSTEDQLSFFETLLSLTFIVFVFRYFRYKKSKGTKAKNSTINIDQNDGNINRLDDMDIDNIELYRKHINESIHIINNTKIPDTFFSRYDLIIERLNQIIYLSQNANVEFSGEHPKEFSKSFQSSKVNIINNFIDRYYQEVSLKVQGLKTKKARINNVSKFYESLIKYKHLLEDDNLDKIHFLHSKLQGLIDV